MQVGTGRQAFLEDPAGNVIELHQTASSLTAAAGRERARLVRCESLLRC